MSWANGQKLILSHKPSLNYQVLIHQIDRILNDLNPLPWPESRYIFRQWQELKERLFFFVFFFFCFFFNDTWSKKPYVKVHMGLSVDRLRPKINPIKE